MYQILFYILLAFFAISLWVVANLNAERKRMKKFATDMQWENLKLLAIQDLELTKKNDLQWELDASNMMLETVLDKLPDRYKNVSVSIAGDQVKYRMIKDNTLVERSA